MKIERQSLDSIKPYPGNPRVNDAAVQSLANSIRRFGFRQPIVVDAACVIIVGHTRWKAARLLELPDVPVHVATDLTPDEVRAYRLADNKTHELSEWDRSLLKGEIAALLEVDFELTQFGFGDEEIRELLAPAAVEGLTDPDDVPAPPDEATTKRGEIWALGQHRLMCGDSALAADVDRLLAGELVHLVNTDPPYNVRVEPRSNNAIAAGTTSGAHHQAMDKARHPNKTRRTDAKMRPKDRPLLNDFVSDQEFDRLLSGWFGNIGRVLVPGRSFYIWGGYANCSNYPPALKANGLYFSQAIIWVKQHAVLSRKDFMGDHEWCFYGWVLERELKAQHLRSCRSIEQFTITQDRALLLFHRRWMDDVHAASRTSRRGEGDSAACVGSPAGGRKDRVRREAGG